MAESKGIEPSLAFLPELFSRQPQRTNIWLLSKKIWWRIWESNPSVKTLPEFSAPLAVIPQKLVLSKGIEPF